MKKFIIVIIPSLIFLHLSVLALSLQTQAQTLRTIEEHNRLGHRGSALAYHQNAERRALQRHQKEERKLLRVRRINRRALVEHQREEQRQLKQRQPLEREAIRPSREDP